MNAPRPNSPAASKASRPVWREPPFDDATNFSLLGWLLDKLRGGKKPERKPEDKIDLTLEE